MEEAEIQAAQNTGSPSSKYEHRQASALLCNIQNIRICMGKKPIVSVTYENERILIKNSLPYLKCVLRLSCAVHDWPTTTTDPPKENGDKFAPTAPIASKFHLGNTW